MESSGGNDVRNSSTLNCCNPLEEKEPATEAVKVVLHIRPLIESEGIRGYKDCITVVPGEPQVQIGNRSFTFDCVYGSTGSPSSAIFEECVAPLIDGLFHGYNGTVLAYGQTGSGKTYTMGTGYTVGSTKQGVIPQAMEMIFRRIDSLKVKANLQLRVSFIEILKEKLRDLLDPSLPSAIKSDLSYGFGLKPAAPVKPPIRIRETMNGGITLTGVTEIEVNSPEEMASCLEQGSLYRATASTNMNLFSSRSHAIFTITLEQRRKWEVHGPSLLDDGDEDFMCAKLHLIDLAGSERVKRTGTYGLRFKEGVHINKGLLALGNVISALGDEMKRKERVHVPYRNSKLTRLLQDSLGGNSRTIMIACISPTDTNREETLNTLKYANRARNIQNKPIVNRDPLKAEMQRLRQQLELLQGEISRIREGAFPDDTQMLRQRIAWLEASNAELHQELQESCNSLKAYAQRAMNSQVEKEKLQLKLQLLRCGKSWDELYDDADEVQTVGLLQSSATVNKHLDSELPQSSIFSVKGSCGINNEATSKELEHSLQDSMDKEFKGLNERLEEKETEMKASVKLDSLVLKQQFEWRLMELEEEKKALQREKNALLSQIEDLAATAGDQTQKMQESYLETLKTLEIQIEELKMKQDNQAQLLKEKQESEEAAKYLQEEIQRIKAQKVQVQHKMKQELEQFRIWKASHEKELVQLHKEGRRHAFEMLKLQALNQRQKMVLHRKTEEATMVSRRLRELLEARKASPSGSTVSGSIAVKGSRFQRNENALQQWLEHELKVAVHIHDANSTFEKKMESPGVVQASPILSNARQTVIGSLESMLSDSSSTFAAMPSPLSEAEQQHSMSCARWQHLQTMGDARNSLQYVFNAAVNARCQLLDKDQQNGLLLGKVAELTELLRQRENCIEQMEKQKYLKGQIVSKAFTATSTVSDAAVMDSVQDLLTSGNSDFQHDLRKVVSTSRSASAKQEKMQAGKSGRPKRSHQRWSLQFKWKWQKPWRLSEWIRHGDEAVRKVR
eukprot:c14348_g1_i1 orf=1037-4090(-)